MSISCVICGLWYHTEGRDTLDICPPCFAMNFAAAQPPLDPWGSAREALEAFVSQAIESSVCQGITPHQREAMARLHQHWEAEAQRRSSAAEDT